MQKDFIWNTNTLARVICTFYVLKMVFVYINKNFFE